MAKGNLFQGMARGKIGDVVFYRMNGVQMSRVRNRVPKNPRSVEQLYQRSVIATVMKLYSAGKEIFDHAFQGYTVGEGCMRRFNSLNANILRYQIVNDVNNNVALENQVGRVVYPRSMTFVPIEECIISEGTLEQNMFIMHDVEGQGLNLRMYTLNLTASDNEGDITVEQYMRNHGIYAGDIFTFCMGVLDTQNVIYQNISIPSEYTKVYKATFEWMRLIVKSNISETLKVNDAKYSDIFNIESNFTMLSFNADGKITANIGFQYKRPANTVTIGCIRSREDVDLRSTSYMHYTKSKKYGIASEYIIPVWQEEISKIGNSDLILEGGEGPTVNTMNLQNIDNGPIIPADVNEATVRRTARHKGTQNNPE